MAVHANCNLIAVTGGKGGVGKSVFAANLAAAFLTEFRAPTLLVDLDAHSCGDQNFLLGFREVRTVKDLASQTSSLLNAPLPQVLNAHASGLFYLAAVKGRDETLNVSPDVAMKQLEALSTQFRFIVVDIGTHFSPLQMALLDRATVILMVTLPEVICVNQTLRLQTDLLSASIPGDMLQVVVNRVTPTSLAPAAISQTLKRQVIGAIPHDDVSATNSIQRSTPFVLSAPKSPISASHFEVARRLTGGILQQLKNLNRPQEFKFKRDSASGSSGADSVGAASSGGRAAGGAEASAGSSSARLSGSSQSKQVDARIALKLTVHAELIKAMDLSKNLTDTKGDEEKEKELRKKTHAVISSLVDREAPGLGREERGQIIKEVLDEALGLGPLEDLLEEQSVSEIMVNGYNKIYIEKGGTLQESPIKFTSNYHLKKVIERIVLPLGRQINESVPYVDARLKDGSRVNAVIEPLAIDGPSLTIRKFRKKPVTVETYVNEFKSATANMMEFLRLAVQYKMNIVISGGTGSGKTMLLNTLSGFIPANERIVTIEDAAELQLKQEHIVRLETRPPNPEGNGAVTIRDLVRNSLRMRPDRIVVGECRDGAALDMLQAMRTGHDGSMTTIHSNNPKEAVGRLETLCLMAGLDLPARAIREQIAGGVNYIVQISRLSDGSRKITSITEIQGMQGETVTLQPVFSFTEKDFDKNRKIIGEFRASGLIPKFIESLQRRGVAIPPGLFANASMQAASNVNNNSNNSNGNAAAVGNAAVNSNTAAKPSGAAGGGASGKGGGGSAA